MKEREEELKCKQMSGNKLMNPFIFAGLPDRVQNKFATRGKVRGTEDLLAIARLVQEATGISIEDLQSLKRDRPIVEARQLYMYFAYHVSQNLIRVAAFVNRDHSTCIYAIKQTLIRRNGYGEETFKDQFRRIDEKVNVKTVKGKLGQQYKDTPYIVYPDGRVVNGRLGKDIKPFTHKSGQIWVSLFIDKKNGNGKGVKKLVKAMVAECFLENPFQKKIIIHKDGDTKNNHVDNLFWGDRKEQQQHILKHQLKTTKFDGEQIMNIRSMYEKGKSQANIADIMKCSRSMINLIVKKKIYNFV